MEATLLYVGNNSGDHSTCHQWILGLPLFHCLTVETGLLVIPDAWLYSTVESRGNGLPSSPSFRLYSSCIRQEKKGMPKSKMKELVKGEWKCTQPSPITIHTSVLRIREYFVSGRWRMSSRGGGGENIMAVKFITEICRLCYLHKE